MKKFIKTRLGNTIIIICKILNLFINFQFCHLYTSRIGHQTVNFDIALISIKKKTFIFCSHDTKVANNYILSFFKNQKNVFFLQIFKYFYFLIYFVDNRSKFIITWEQYQPKFTVHLNNKSNIIFPHYSQSMVNEILLKYKLKRNFVGLYSRNSLYVEKNNLNDKNFHGYRDFDFEDFKLAINFLKNQNSIIKLGESYLEENFEQFKTKIFTSLDFNSNEEVDYILNAYSRYNVMGDSGVSGISSMLRKKIVYVNLIPLNLEHLSYCSPGSIILPKKIYDLKKSRYLTFSENLEINFSLHSINNPYEENNLKVTNNSPEDILNAIVEMENKIKNISNDNEGKRLNELFWKNISKKDFDKINYLKDKQELTISSSFLKKNQDLL